MAARLAAALLTLTTSAAASAPAEGEARLLRFPHIQGDKIAFVYGGDIWTASASGGSARRVTSYDEGFELFPRISPDGEWIAAAFPRTAPAGMRASAPSCSS